MWTTDQGALVHIIDDELYSFREKIATKEKDGTYWHNGKKVVVDTINESETKQLIELNSVWSTTPFLS